MSASPTSKSTPKGPRSRRGGLLGLLAAWVVALTAASLAIVTVVSTLANLERECSSAFDDLDPADLGGSDADDDSADVDLELPALVPANAFGVPVARVSGLWALHERTRGAERSTSPPERPPSLDA